MGVVVVVVPDPLGHPDLKVEWVVPIVRPDDIFFDGAHDPLGIRVALGVRPGDEDLLKAQDRTVHHEALRCGLTTVVRK